MEQLYAVQVDLAKVYPQHSEQYLQGGPARFILHSGGRGNGAAGGLYSKKQINRIIGRYPEGAAKAIPVAFGLTQVESDENASEAEILSKARAYGVDNWAGWMEWETGEDDDDN